jgi:hypothetical protein
MTKRPDELEATLLALGRQEFLLQQEAQRLRDAGREAIKGGRLADADAAWELFEVIREQLKALQDAIRTVEARLYGLRRSTRKS